MGELWRSQHMTLLQLFVQAEAAHDVVEALGELGAVQFTDLNPHVTAHTRNFVTELKRLRDLEFIIQTFITQIRKTNMSLKKIKANKNQYIRLTPLGDIKQDKEINIDILENHLNTLSTQMGALNENQQKIEQNIQQMTEMKAILGVDEEGFFSDIGDEVIESSEEVVDFNLDDLGPIQISERKGKKNENVDDDALRFITGVIQREKFETFEKTLFRISRSSALMRYRELEIDFIDEETKQTVKKNSFIIFYRGAYLGEKITKLAHAYGSHVYPCPQTHKERKTLRKQLQVRLEEFSDVKEKGIFQMRKLMEQVAQNVDLWHHYTLKEVAIYDTLNLFNYDQGRQTLIGECWCPTDSIPLVKEALAKGKERSGSSLDSILSVIETKQEPPTHFKTNKFTKIFQKIVDSYGIARYREVNPAVFTVITFPWQFGIMFGDVGHGSLLLLLSLFLIWKEKDWEGQQMNEILAWPYKGRYLLLLMAFYAIWMGALYNEFFSVGMDFGSRWELQVGPEFNNDTLQQKIPSPLNTYAFGIDPVWKLATNELLYYNSVKMKSSIIIGVLQMSVGLFLHLLNGIEFKKPYDIFFEFLPRFIFLQAIFGYLCFMIIYKWCVDWMGRDIFNAEVANMNITTLKGTAQAPGLLNELIYMFLPGGPGNNLYDVQNQVQSAMVVLAGISIPWMFLPKPLLLRREHMKAQRAKEANGVTSTNVTKEHEIKRDSSEESLEELEGKGKEPMPSTPEVTHPTGESEEEEFQFGELMIHQLLETIEFVLGSVSHTASYLRLWALSLAHSELATVFWNKVMFQVMFMTKDMNIVVIGLITFAGFSVWWTITLLVMMFMELLSALLHALRLHWVEFQSKFYKGDGYLFRPFSFRKVFNGNRLPDVTKLAS